MELIFVGKGCVEQELDQAGAVLVEWAIVAAGLFLGFLIAFDVAQAINRYMILTQAAYEGARFASVVPGMEPGQHSNLAPTNDEKSDCISRTPTTYPCNHYYVQQRVLRAIENLNTMAANGAGGNSVIVTEYIPSTAGLGANDDTVTVSIGSSFSGLSIGGFPIQVEHQMSYLYEST